MPTKESSQRPRLYLPLSRPRVALSWHLRCPLVRWAASYSLRAWTRVESQDATFFVSMIDDTSLMSSLTFSTMAKLLTPQPLKPIQTASLSSGAGGIDVFRCRGRLPGAGVPAGGGWCAWEATAAKTSSAGGPFKDNEKIKGYKTSENTGRTSGTPFHLVYLNFHCKI